MASARANVSVDHFEWLVDGRSRNQKSTFELYRIISETEDKLNNNAELQVAAQQLAGIAFSLWRAVFLSDTTGENIDRWADVKTFMISLISDNTVLYVTDKNARNWSFRYYLSNATYRLSELASSDLALLEQADLSRAAGSEKEEWLNAQAALEKALSTFERAVQGTAAPLI